MKFIGHAVQFENSNQAWMKDLLGSFSTGARRDQLVHILNGYADLYQMVLYFIPCNDQEFTDTQDIATYQGTAPQAGQRPPYQRNAFIMFNFERALFAPLYVTDNEDRPKTLFTIDEQSMVDHVCEFLLMHNGRRYFSRN
jgi:hypothetical protein